MTNSRLYLTILLALCVSYAIGHSYVTEPESRTNQKSTQSGCRGPQCLGPCDAPLSATRTPAVTIARGAPITVKWPRNNHAGGFIRLAWTQTSLSDVHANFDAGVQEIVCHENGGCYPDDPSNPNGGDSGPSDGSSRACSTSITVPLYLADGEWTLQWAWFGGAFALGDYYSCVDYKISGGPTGAKLDAVFNGGDYTYPGQNKCKFFNTDRLHACVNEPCNNPVYTLYQEQSGPAFGFSSANSKPLTTSAPMPLTTSQAPAKPLTTSQVPAKPLTTGHVVPATTGRVSLTSGSKPASPSTTGKVAAIPSNPTNCAGLTNQVTSTNFEITAVDTWSNVFRMEFRMDINEPVSDWMVQVIFPDDAYDTDIQYALNAGELRCSATVPTRHSMIEPVAQWANKVVSGEQMYIEFRATNTNMNAAFLQSNTQLKMFRK